jgi:hypothetical protein
LRKEKAILKPGSFDDPKNIMNCNEGFWDDGTDGDNNSSKYIKDSFKDLSFNDICSSEFLSAIAGVSVLFNAADLLDNNKTAFSRMKDRPANNSVFFWLESARRFSCGPNDTMNWYNRITTEKYLYFYSKLESKRYRESMAAFAGYWGIFPK